jgi:hypothetical protein
MLKWNDDRSVLKIGKKTYKAGDEIPAEKLSDSRIKHLIEKKKIKSFDYIEVEKSTKKNKKKNSKKSAKPVQAEIKPDNPGGVENASTEG